MRKILILFLLVPVMAGAQHSLPNGAWQGVLKAGADLHLVFTFTGATPLKAKLACVEQGVKDLPADSAYVYGDSLAVEFRALGARYVGRFEGDSAVSGEWRQGLSLPLRISPTVKPVAMNRPQTPRPPFPYTSSEASYASADGSIRYAGTLTEPGGSGPFPAIVLITGSGQQNRDEELFGHKPFAVLADYLTRRGFAVLRVDDRGVGGTTGSATHATSADFADDVSYGLDFLSHRPEIDKKRLGLIGHSEGGLIAPMVARRRNDVSFMVLLAGTGVRGDEVLAIQNEAILRSQGLPKETIDVYMPLFRHELQVFARRPLSDQPAVLDSLLIDWMAHTPAATVRQLTSITDEASRKNYVKEVMNGIGTDWFRYFFTYDPLPAIENYRGKLLALNGSRDIQVLSDANLGAIRKAIAKHHRSAQEAVELPGLNHLFQKCATCALSEYGQLEETISPLALDTIGQWLEENVMKKM